MTTTAADIIKSALRKIGAIDPEETPSSAMYQVGLEALNVMLHDWSTSAIGIYATTKVTKTLTASDGDYTIGTGGDINTGRPTKIANAWIVANGSNYTLSEISRDEYHSIADKTVTGLPEYYWLNPTFPLSTLNLYPEPVDAYVLHMELWSPVAQYTSTSDSIGLPPEYESALRTNLAVELALEFDSGQVSQFLYSKADMTLKRLKNRHSSPNKALDTRIFKQHSNSDIFSGY